MPGTLYVVSTSIGNVDDLPPRARETLARVGVVACEDTRHTGRLFARCGIETRLLSLHEHNEARRVPRLIETLESGDDVALVSDAGTPLLSDPGFLLVREAVARGIDVSPIPGPSALLAALVVSGLPPYPLTFAGFAPRKAGKRRKLFERLGALEHTVVVYESPHRLLATLAAIEETLGDRPVAVCRELTKLHEEVRRGTAGELARDFAARPSIKGEIVIVIGPG